MAKKSVLIFTKVPIAGLVKTRLSHTTPLTDLEASLLAEAMLKDTIINASQSETEIIEIGYYPEQYFKKLEQIVDSIQKATKIYKHISYYLQKGTSFDERFESVVQASIDNGNENLIILGADLPYMSSSLINTTFTHLTTKNSPNNIVIGPSGEGGIYLVGISRDFLPNWFTKYKLFTDGVELIQFSKLCREEKIKLRLLPPLFDIDIEDDLVSLIALIEGLKAADKNEDYCFPYYTTEVIESLGLYIEQGEGINRNRKISKKYLV